MEKTKNIPKIRFKGYKDEWEKTQLNDIGNKYTSLTGKTKEDFGHGEGRYIIFTNVLANPVALLDGVEKIEIDKRQNEVKNGDLFFNISSETYEEVGMSSVWTYDKENYYLNSFCMGFRPNVELDSYFITHSLRSQAAREQIIKLAQGISRINISQTKMLDININIPSIEEQKQIGSLFKNLDEKLEIEREKHEKLVNFKKAMLENVFPKEGEKRPKIRFGGYNDDWKGLKIKDIGIIKTGKTPPTADRINYTDRGMLFITPTDIKNNVTKNTERKLSALGYLKSTVVEPGTILVTCIASIGKNTLIEDFSAFNQQINSITPYNCDSYFVYTLSYHWSNHMSKMAATGTMQIINKNDFSEIETSIPSINEQKFIGSFFKNLDEKIQVSEEKISKIENFKKAMMDGLFV